MTYTFPSTFVSMRWFGAWDATIQYNPGSVVTYRGASWVALAYSTNVTPIAGDTWDRLPGGGSRVVSFPFAFDTVGLLTGATVAYVPTVGELLLDAWIEVITAWEGSAYADIGTFLNSSTSGLFRRTNNAINVTNADNDDDNPGIRIGPNDNSLSLVGASVAGDTQRGAPAKFVQAYPLCVCVSDDGTPSGADPESTVGAGIVHLVIGAP